jgi:malate dehydrogenase
MSKTPIRVCITGAAGQIGYALLPHICLGKTFGPDQPFILHLLDLNIDAVQTNLSGVKMELEDSTYPLLQGVVTTGDPSVAFNGADYVIMLGAFPRKDGMERKDLLVNFSAAFFVSQLRAIFLNDVLFCSHDIALLI